MRKDVIYLKNFYEENLGKNVKSLLASQLINYWGKSENKRVLGIGFTTPLLGELERYSERVISLMPSKQGAVSWQRKGGNLSVLANECYLPFPDNFFDRVIIIHCLEFCDNEKEFLREVWRVVGDEGKILIITPRPMSAWVFFGGNPYSNSKTYSIRNLKKILDNALFVPLRHSSILFIPPIRNFRISNFLKKSENFGAKFFSFLCSLNLIEAQKQMYIITAQESKLNLIKKYFISQKRGRQVKS